MPGGVGIDWFVGQWLVAELQHQIVMPARLDVQFEHQGWPRLRVRASAAPDQRS